MRGSRGGRRGRGRGRGRGGRGRGRGKKSAKIIESDDEEMPHQSGEEAPEENDENQQPSNKQSTEEWPEQQQQLDMEADISLLEAPTFTTINRGPPEPMLRLSWDHRVNLMGEKVLNPMIHCCDQCNKPILIYGRMIPCKHVFCLKCAKQEEKICPRCNDKVLRVEQAGLGTVFMCVHGGTRYGNVGCRRTYLSQRDLQAHINHRHTVQSADTANSQFASHMKEAVATPSPVGKMLPTPVPTPHSSHHQVSHVTSHAVSHSSGSSQSRVKSDPRASEVNHHRNRGGPSPPPPPPPPYAPMQHRPPMMVAPGYPPSGPPPQSNMRTNLITVPIQDVEMPPTTYHHHYTQPPPPQYTHSAYSVPPPQQAPQYYPPVTYATGVQPQYVQGVPQVVGQGVPQVQVQQVPQIQAVPQGMPQGLGVRPPQYPETQYRTPPPVPHGQQWQLTSANPPPTFYR